MTIYRSNLAAPVANADSAAYWAAAREQRLVLRQCRTCGARHFMPRCQCPTCWSDELDWIESAGEGAICSFSVVHRAPTLPFAERVPYVIALVDLDEGPRIFANVVGEQALAVQIGDRVRVVYEQRHGDALVPQFVRLPR